MPPDTAGEQDTRGSGPSLVAPDLLEARWHPHGADERRNEEHRQGQATQPRMRYPSCVELSPPPQWTEWANGLNRYEGPPAVVRQPDASPEFFYDRCDRDRRLAPSTLAERGPRDVPAWAVAPPINHSGPSWYQRPLLRGAGPGVFDSTNERHG